MACQPAYVVVFLILDPDLSTCNQVIITDRGSKGVPGGACTMQMQGPGNSRGVLSPRDGLHRRRLLSQNPSREP